ncbi:MAG: carbon starvation protein A [Lentisphaeria bacterium]|nr:carbon starvation protein A [Lentisphaeria bacterium]
MLMFLGGLVILLVGYLLYGRLVEWIVGVEPKRATPAVVDRDGVDYVAMPHWKNMMIQLLNIAGVGPVIGVILGIKFGTIVFLIIPIGNIIGGAVHDFVAGVMSLRKHGANLPTLIKNCNGSLLAMLFSIFMTILLLLVVAVFITTPAQLCDSLVPSANILWYAVAVIFIYYIISTIFPVDKIIGMCYPLFGALLLIGTLALFVKLMFEAGTNPALLQESEGFRKYMFTAENHQPVIPLLFVTIACGILSGFHATQSPIIARTMPSEREARSDFYGMMVLEGFIAMVWAAGGLAIYNLFPEQMLRKAPEVLQFLCAHFLGGKVGALVVVSVIILSITSGDTAMRSLRLSLAEIFRIPQKKLSSRVLLCLPIIVVVALLIWWSAASAKSFNLLWNYFAWGNQVLAAFTLTAATEWLIARRRNAVITIIPGVFMTFIVLCYILWISPAHGGPVGFGLELHVAQIVAAVLAGISMALAIRRGMKMRERR